MNRPPRTDAHRQRDELIAQFAAVGLTPVVSTNGGVPEADIQVAKALLTEGGKHGELIEARLTDRGRQRLADALVAQRDAQNAAVDAQPFADLG